MSEAAVDRAFKNQIVRWDLVPADQLLANPGNWRAHPVPQREALRGSLTELGMIAPVLVNLRTGYMIDGHARVEEILSRDPSTPIPVAYVDLSPEEEAIALTVFDPITGLAEANREALEALMNSVQPVSPELQKLLADMAAENNIKPGSGGGGGSSAPDPGADLDKADELLEKWGVVPGQIWQVGNHHLLCGDILVLGNLERLMGDNKAQMCWTDPPWNVAYGLNHPGPKWSKRTIANDNLGEDFPAFASQFCARIADCVVPGAAIYMAMSAQEWPVIHKALLDAGFHWSSTIIWVKDHAVLSRKDYHTRYEPLWYGWREGAPRLVQLEDRTQNDVWEIDRPTKSEEHPTQKPVELVARSVMNSSVAGTAVLDPFLGSGTTAVACEQTGRVCFGADLEPKYIAVTLERLVGMGLEARVEEQAP